MGEANSDGEADLDLFGEPYTAAERGRGRPPHQPDAKTVNRVILGFARGWSVKKVALSIGVSAPTLRQYYFSHVARRDQMALMMESVQLGRLNAAAEAGNITAEKELTKQLEKGRIEQLPKTMKPAKASPLGKKQQRHVDAVRAHEQSSWGDLVGGDAIEGGTGLAH